MYRILDTEYICISISAIQQPNQTKKEYTYIDKWNGFRALHTIHSSNLYTFARFSFFFHRDPSMRHVYIYIK